MFFLLLGNYKSPGFNRSNLFFTADFKSAGTPSGGSRAFALSLFLRPVTVGSGRIAAMELDSIEHNLDEIVDGALVAGVGTEGTAVGDDHAAGECFMAEEEGEAS